MKFAAVLLTSLLVSTLPALAQSAQSQIEAQQVWARATPGGAKTGAVYMTLVDKGKAGDRLVGASTPVAAMAQLHQSSVENGVMKMREISGVDIAPGGSATFKPGAMHVMLTGLKKPLKLGDSFPMTLTFEKAGKVDVTVKVEKAGAMGMPAMDQGGSHDMKGTKKP